MKFEDIVGNVGVKNQLIQAIYNQKPSQSYIFDGRNGIGKGSIANIFAMGLLCENFHDNPCEVCDSCTKILSKNHPDIYEVFPDGASIKTKQIEALQEFIMSKPFLADRKIIIIYCADLMTVPAQNKLLKTLEEPPSDSILILITENISALLPTVRSRCQIMSFQRLSKDEIANVLIDKYGIDSKNAVSQGLLADGSLAVAIENIEDENVLNIRHESLLYLKSIIGNDISEMLLVADKLAENKEYLESALMSMKLWVRDIVLLKLGIDKQMLFNADDISQLQNVMDALQTYQWIQIIDNIEEARKQCKAYVQTGLVIEGLGLNIQEDINGSGCRCSI